MLKRLAGLVRIMEMKQILGLDNAWREEDEQLLF